MHAFSPALVKRLALALVCLSLGACSSLPSFKSLASVSGDKVMGLVTPYRLEIVQGNVLTKEQVAEVKPGMTRDQVRGILGTPLLIDMFHTNRWDYTFSLRRQGFPFEQRQVVAWFDGDKLTKLDTPDTLPTEDEFVAAISKPVKLSLPTLELSEAQLKALPVPKAQAVAAPEEDKPLRHYPPLESAS